MRVLFDTNVILDALLKRRPFFLAAGELMALVEAKKLSGFLSAITPPTILYVARKTMGGGGGRDEIRKLLMLFDVARVDKQILQLALEEDFSDYEDGVIHRSALAVRAQGIVTRNTRDFKNSAIPVYSPEELLAKMDAESRTRRIR